MSAARCHNVHGGFSDFGGKRQGDQAVKVSNVNSLAVFLSANPECEEPAAISLAMLDWVQPAGNQGLLQVYLWVAIGAENPSNVTIP